MADGRSAVGSAYPSGSSHLRDWVFPSAQAYREAKLKYFMASLDSIVQKLTAESPAPISTYQHLIETYPELKVPVSVDDQHSVIQYYVTQIQKIAEQKKFEFRICNCAINLFLRYYLRTSISETRPSLVALTCIELSLKIENDLRFMPVKSLFEGLGAVVDLASIFRYELPVLSRIGFQIHILTIRPPIFFFSDAYHRKVGRTGHFALPDKLKSCGLGLDEGNSPASTDGNLRKTITEWHKRCEKHCFRLLHVDSVAFLYTPAQLGFTLFRHVGIEEFGLSDVDSFLRETCAANGSSEANMKTLMRCVTELTAHLWSWRDGDVDAMQAQVGKTLEDFDTWKKKVKKICGAKKRARSKKSPEEKQPPTTSESAESSLPSSTEVISSNVDVPMSVQEEGLKEEDEHYESSLKKQKPSLTPMQPPGECLKRLIHTDTAADEDADEIMDMLIGGDK